MIGNLANRVIFKKVFTDKVKTEKCFDPKISHIDFEYAILYQNSILFTLDGTERHIFEHKLIF